MNCWNFTKKNDLLSKILRSVFLFVVMILSYFPFFQSDAVAQLSHIPKLPELYVDDGDGFIVIAHRGASAYAPENTIPAFQKAVEMEAEMVELDVLISKDGVPVVFHDAKLDKKSNGSGLVSDYTLSELKELDAGSWFSNEFNGIKIPTLDEVLGYAKDKISVNIEIKTEAVTDKYEGGVVHRSVELVKKQGMQEYVIFSSFDYRAIKQVKTHAPGMSAALLYEETQSGKKSPSQLTAEYKTDAFNCSYRQLSKKWMNSLKKSGIPVFVYTVNEEKRMEKLIKQGVKGIFSDKPDVLKAVAQKAEKGN